MWVKSRGGARCRGLGAGEDPQPGTCPSQQVARTMPGESKPELPSPFCRRMSLGDDKMSDQVSFSRVPSCFVLKVCRACSRVNTTRHLALAPNPWYNASSDSGP